MVTRDLDLLVGVNIDVSAMEEDEPDATEDNAEEEGANQVNEETDHNVAEVILLDKIKLI